MSEAAEKAWDAHKESVYQSTEPFGPKHAFVVGYDAGRGSRDAEVESLTAQLAESERVAQVRLERLDQLLSESGSYNRARSAASAYRNEEME